MAEVKLQEISTVSDNVEPLQAFEIPMLVPLVDQYIYIDTKDSYLRISDKQILTPKALNTVHIQQYPGGEIPKACVVFDTDPARRVCSGLGWMPVPDSIIELGGVKYANTFTGFAVEPVAGDVSEWLALCEHIYGEHVDLVLDHMAFTVQFPMKKIRWQILVLGKPRTGKSMTVRPMAHIWGNAAKSISQDEHAAGWGDIYAGRKFVTFEEVYQPDNKRFFNDLKIKLANDDVEHLNMKGGKLMTQMNLYSMILFSNHFDGLPFNEDEDKLLVIEATSEKWTADRYAALADAIDDGGLSGCILHFLLNRDVSNFSYGRLPVRTEALRKLCEESRADYQKWIIERAESGSSPFNYMHLTLSAIKKAKRDAGYSFGGDKGISEALQAAGWNKYRGAKKVNGKVLATPTIWTKEDYSDKSPAEIYDAINNHPMLDEDPFLPLE